MSSKGSSSTLQVICILKCLFLFPIKVLLLLLTPPGSPRASCLDDAVPLSPVTCFLYLDNLGPWLAGYFTLRPASFRSPETPYGPALGDRPLKSDNKEHFNFPLGTHPPYSQATWLWESDPFSLGHDRMTQK